MAKTPKTIRVTNDEPARQIEDIGKKLIELGMSMRNGFEVEVKYVPVEEQEVWGAICTTVHNPGQSGRLNFLLANATKADAQDAADRWAAMRTNGIPHQTAVVRMPTSSSIGIPDDDLRNTE